MGFMTPHTDINDGCECMGCRMLRNYEKEHGLHFKDHDL